MHITACSGPQRSTGGGLATGGRRIAHLNRRGPIVPDPLVQSYLLLARDSMLSALYAIANPSVRPPVCPSVRHTGGSVENG